MAALLKVVLHFISVKFYHNNLIYHKKFYHNNLNASAG